MDEKETISKITSSTFAWFLLAFLVGLGLRLWRLGEMRFTLAETQIAQGAWQMALGDASGLTGNISYAGLSAVVFRIFEPSFFFARLLPAVAGSSLILVPWFWQDQLGNNTALALAIGLAIDPILLSFSRQIATPIFVLAGLAWAVTALKIKRPVLAGSMLAIAFLGGYTFWVAALAGGVAFLVFRKHELFNLDILKNKSFLLPLLTSFVISLLLVSSAFLLCSAGLGGIGAGVVEFIRLFGSQYKYLLYHSILVAIAYSLLPIVLLIWRVAVELRNKQPLSTLPYLIGWLLSIILSVLLGRQDLGLLAFASVFAWLGAAEGFVRMIEFVSQEQKVVLGVTLFQIVILGYIQMVVGRLVSLPIDSQDFRFTALTVAAGILLLAISTILVGMGWSREVARQALQNSLLIMLCFLTLGISIRPITTRQESNTLSLLAGPILLPNNDVESIVNEIDREGRADKTEITYDLGNLGQQFTWFFREQVASKGSQRGLQADLMLSANEMEFSAANAYRGRNVVLFRQIDQQVVKPGDFLKTLIGEPLPMVSQNGVLWVRLNLFTGAN